VQYGKECKNVAGCCNRLGPQSGYHKIRLDPADTMAAAVKVYRQAGFFEIQYQSSYPGTAGPANFELPLAPVLISTKTGVQFAGKVVGHPCWDKLHQAATYDQPVPF